MNEEQKEKWYKAFTREQLIERCEYLQRSCERKENSIMELEMEIADLEKGYCELKEKCNKGECDCTHEEYNNMCEANIELNLEIERLKEELEYTISIVEHNKTITKHLKEIERLNNILDTLMQDMALLNATSKKEIKPKYVFDRIATLRGDDKE